jgi:hypothetical protein
VAFKSRGAREPGMSSNGRANDGACNIAKIIIAEIIHIIGSVSATGCSGTARCAS